MAFTRETPDDGPAPMLALEMGMDGRRRGVAASGVAQPEETRSSAQLAFPFAGPGQPQPEGTPAEPTSSRRALRAVAPERRVTGPTLERPLEEVRLEQCLRSHLPAGRG